MKLTLAALLMLLSTPAWGLSCDKRDTVVDYLALKYAEQPIGVGINTGGSVLEILVSPGGTWTVLITKENGMACYVASGESWVTIPVKSGQPL